MNTCFFRASDNDRSWEIFFGLQILTKDFFPAILPGRLPVLRLRHHLPGAEMRRRHCLKIIKILKPFGNCSIRI